MTKVSVQCVLKVPVWTLSCCFQLAGIQGYVIFRDNSSRSLVSADRVFKPKSSTSAWNEHFCRYDINCTHKCKTINQVVFSITPVNMYIYVQQLYVCILSTKENWCTLWFSGKNMRICQWRQTARTSWKISDLAKNLISCIPSVFVSSVRRFSSVGAGVALLTMSRYVDLFIARKENITNLINNHLSHFFLNQIFQTLSGCRFSNKLIYCFV